jgi:UDP-N-acetyl-D-glucosamine dehydrogenase
LPLDPLYLSWKARAHGFEARLIELAAEINSYMPHYVVDRVIAALNERKKALKGSKILVLGVTYKKDIDDIRESPALAIMNSLIEKEAKVQYHDPLIPEFEIDGLKFASIGLTKEAVHSSDCIVIVTDHSSIDYKLIVDNADLILDTRNVLKDFKEKHNIVKL